LRKLKKTHFSPIIISSTLTIETLTQCGHYKQKGYEKLKKKTMRSRRMRQKKLGKMNERKE
jgi:hypothetical protein